MNPGNPITKVDQKEMIVRRVKVDRNRTPKEVIDAIDYMQFIDSDVLATMPVGEGKEVYVYFFEPEPWEYDLDKGVMSPSGLETALERRGLKSDPYAQAQVNIDDPAFADSYPNNAQWDVRDGESSDVMFSRCHGERLVDVHRGANRVWYRGWWPGGVRKDSPLRN